MLSAVQQCPAGALVHAEELTRVRTAVMDLRPEISDLSTQSTVQGGVIINTSEADTRVMVDDGQTAVIGGLICATIPEAAL